MSFYSFNDSLESSVFGVKGQICPQNPPIFLFLLFLHKCALVFLLVMFSDIRCLCQRYLTSTIQVLPLSSQVRRCPLSIIISNEIRHSRLYQSNPRSLVFAWIFIDQIKNLYCLIFITNWVVNLGGSKILN